MRRNWNCCHISLISICSEILEFPSSIHRENRIPISPPPSALSPDSSSLSFHSEYAAVSYQITPWILPLIWFQGSMALSALTCTPSSFLLLGSYTLSWGGHFVVLRYFHRLHCS